MENHNKTYLYKTISMGKADEAQDRAESYAQAAGLVPFSLWARNALDKASGYKSPRKPAKSKPGANGDGCSVGSDVEISKQLP